MITFKQFINENATGKQYSLTEICKKISDECGEFLTQSGNLPLMRGLTATLGRGHPPQEIEQPVDRPPKDSDAGFNIFFNAGIQAVHKIREIRSKTLYATGSAIQARQYGNIMYVFPKDGFKFLYSASVEDSYEDSSNLYVLLCDKLSAAGVPINKYEFGLLLKYLVSEGVTAEDLLRSPRIPKMLDQYYDGEISNIYNPTIKMGDVFRKCLADTFKELDFRSDSIKNAISAKTEISFYQSEGYYLVPLQAIRNHFSDLPKEELDTPTQCYEKLLTLF